MPPYRLVYAAVLVAFGMSLLNGFALDDLIHIQDNYRLRLPDYGVNVLSHPAFPGNLYRPVTFWTYYLQMATSGIDPFAYHLLNLALHGLVAMLVFELFAPRFSYSVALTAATIFAVHPVATESVANVSGRAELLAALFVLLSLWLVSNSKNSDAVRMVMLSLTSFLAAASKESAVCLPLLMSLWVTSQPGESVKKSRMVWPIAASLFGICCYLGLRFIVLGGVLYSASAVDPFDNPLAKLSPGRRIVEAVALLGDYFATIFSPVPLSADYSYAVLTFPENVSLFTLFRFGVVVSVALMALVLRRRCAGLALPLLWFFAAFVCTGNILFPIGTVFAERLLYLPGIGVIVFASALLGLLKPAYLRWLTTCLLILAATIYSAAHTRVWHDTATLADYQEGVSADSFRTQLLLAARDKNRQDFTSALSHIERSLAILPQNEDAWYLKGAVLIEQGDYGQAESSFQQALTLNSAHLPTMALYARLMINVNQLDRAETLAQSLQALQPDAPEGLLAILAIALKRNDLTRARTIAADLQRKGHQSDDFSRLKRYLERQSVN